MVRQRFALGLLGPKIDSPILPLSRVLSTPETVPIDADLSRATLIATCGGHSVVPSYWKFGALEALAPQFDAAADRLAVGDVAIIRSAIDDVPVVDYLLFEPTAGMDTVDVTRFRPPAAAKYIYPTSPKHGRELYDLYDHDRSALVATTEQGPVRFGRAMLTRALRREAARAREIASR